MIDVTIPVKVFLEPDKTQPSGYRFLHVKVGDEPAVPLPPDRPAPRRLVQTLIEAAKRELEGPAEPAQTPAAQPPGVGGEPGRVIATPEAGGPTG